MGPRSRCLRRAHRCVLTPPFSAAHRMTSTTPPVRGDGRLETPLGIPSTYRESVLRDVTWVAIIRVPMFLSALLALSAVFAVAPLRDAQTGAAEGRLRSPLSYIVLAPLCDVLDAMSTLSVRQHI